MIDPTTPEQPEDSTAPGQPIDWLQQAAYYYNSVDKVADPLTLQLMAHHLERVFNAEVSTDE